MADAGGMKRAAPGGSEGPFKKRKNAWKQGQYKSKAAIESGNSGIFITCDKGKEGRCVREALDLLSQEITIQSGNQKEKGDEASQDDDGEVDDIEAQIKKEVEGMKPSQQAKAPLKSIMLDIPCLLFIKIDSAFDPVQIVHRLCSEAQANPQNKRSRLIRRMTPITLVRKNLGNGLEELAREVLKPHFHSGGPPRKYAIRPTIRNNAALPRDTVINTVARMVGPGHSVDLKNYDLMILVDVVQNLCGMSVVGSDYDKLKRYNIAEIYSPTPRPQPKETKETEETKSITETKAIEQTEQTEDTKVIKEAEQAGEANDVKETGDAKVIKEAGQTGEANDVQETGETGEALDTTDVPSEATEKAESG